MFLVFDVVFGFGINCTVLRKEIDNRQVNNVKCGEYFRYNVEK